MLLLIHHFVVIAFAFFLWVFFRSATISMHILVDCLTKSFVLFFYFGRSTEIFIFLRINNIKYVSLFLVHKIKILAAKKNPWFYFQFFYLCILNKISLLPINQCWWNTRQKSRKKWQQKKKLKNCHTKKKYLKNNVNLWNIYIYIKILWKKKFIIEIISI